MGKEVTGWGYCQPKWEGKGEGFKHAGLDMHARNVLIKAPGKQLEIL